MNISLSIFSPRVNPPLQVVDPVSAYVRVFTLVTPDANMIRISGLLAIGRILLPVASRMSPLHERKPGTAVFPNIGRILVFI
jgi:hypothetical protein